LFNLAWLQPYLDHADHTRQSYSDADVQRTLTRFTAVSIANEIMTLDLDNKGCESISTEVYICGGGAANTLLMADLAEVLADNAVKTTAEIGIDPDWVEAIAFAWLAKQHIHKQPGNLPAVTGASRSAILGAYYPAK